MVLADGQGIPIGALAHLHGEQNILWLPAPNAGLAHGMYAPTPQGLVILQPAAAPVAHLNRGPLRAGTHLNRRWRQELISLSELAAGVGSPAPQRAVQARATLMGGPGSDRRPVLVRADLRSEEH